MDVDELLIADLIIHISIKPIPNLSYKLIKCILRVILPRKLLVKVHLHQACLQLHKTEVARVIGIVNLEAELAVRVIFSQVELKVDGVS